jgi:primosomal protein N' (replication factor Y)
MNADNLLNFPDFRAHERSYQLLQQVAGRAGRTHKRGKVLIQTFNPNHQILQQVSTNDYDGMYKQQNEERYQYKYPPFYRTIKLIFKHRNFQTMQKASIWFGKALEMKLTENVLGPEQPPVSRIRNQYLTNILVKAPRNEALSKTKNHIRTVERNFNAIKEFASVKLIIDVDNY